MRIGSLFAGMGGLDLAVLETFPGAEVAWHSEVMPAACKVLATQWPDVPNLGDITAVDWSQVEPVDVLTGGFPCQDVSAAGKRLGIHPDTRSGLWTHMAYAIDRLRPPLVIIENVRGLLSARAYSDVEPCPWCLGDDDAEPHLRACGAVLGDLADLGYDAEWVGLPASDVGAPHGRFRVFIVAADARSERWDGDEGQLGDRWDSTVRSEAGGHVGYPRTVVAAAANLASPGARHAESNCSDDGQTSDRAVRRGASWGQYAPAIHRWERTLGRAAPSPTMAGPNGGQRLNPVFVEWMMGLPAGWVTDCGLTRPEALTVLGGGVVPQQAVEALRRLGIGQAVAA